MKRLELTTYLDEYLSTNDTPDYPTAVNGLQVEGGSEVNIIMTAVDVSLPSIRAAVEGNADMLIVHHGLFWSGLKPVTGAYKEKLKLLLVGGVSLYSSHLPLDAHPEVGNNAGLLKLCGLLPKDRFGDFKGVKIGFTAETDMTIKALTESLSTGLNTCVRVVSAGGNTVGKVAFVSGGGADSIGEAASMGVDTFVTGECQHHHYLEAEELGINLIYAGHYATETLGVRALGEHLSKRFNLEHEFFDYPTGL